MLNHRNRWATTPHPQKHKMKSETEIRERLSGLLMRELHRRITEAGRRLPHRCKFNHRQPLDGRRTVDGEPNPNFNRVTNGKALPVIGLCGYGLEDVTTWSGNICEDPIDAQRCPLFVPRQTKEAIRQEFEQQLATGWLEENMPEVASLCWALGQVNVRRLPWWHRIVFKFLRVRVEPILTADQAVIRMLGTGDPDSKELLRNLYEEK